MAAVSAAFFDLQAARLPLQQSQHESGDCAWF